MKSRNAELPLPGGVAVPRIRHAPRVRGNDWEDVAELAAGYGLALLPWQENVLEAAMGRRYDGAWAAKHVGLSCPRQNGKSAILDVRALAGLTLFGEQMIVHSAHEVRTAQQGFRRLKSFFENYDDLRRKVASIGNAVAREYIRLRSGQEIKFVTRSRSAIRGFSADCLLLDEAQILSDEKWEAALYNVSARPRHQIWLCGTPPASLEEGAVFYRFRERGIEAKDHRLAWLEWSAEPECDLDDPAQWAISNPALGQLISHTTVATERAAASDEGFARERLGVWSASATPPVFDAGQWERLRDTRIEGPSRVALVIDVAVGGAWTSIGIAGDAPGDRTAVLCYSGRGTAWVADRVAELVASRDVAEIGLTPGEARGLAGDLTREGVEFVKLSATDIAASCSTFQSAVNSGTICHVGQPELDVAIGSARTRRVGDGQSWARDARVDLSPLVACAAAAYQWALCEAPMPAIW